ncbi:hypothetical protein ABBQ32_002551 [Trebouxia sp. C0010 RCD-2024]
MLLSPLWVRVLDHLPILLCSYWTLATAAAAFTLTPGQFCPKFRSAVQLSAARGKLCSSTAEAQLGWLARLKVPQQWFLHFYVVGTACNSFLLYTTLPRSDTAGFSHEQVVTLLSLTLLEVHLIRRMLETAYIMHYPKGAKMHLIAYAFGLSYYLVLPLSCTPAAQLTTQNAYMSELHAPSWTSLAAQPQYLVGAGVFWAGNALQFWSHWILASLQRTTKQTQTTKSRAGNQYYKMPTGGPFYWISCPHYLAEIIIYMGLAILAGQQLPLTILILCWVVANLLLAAQPTHSWYRRHFPAYPRNRKALIPYLY